MLLCAQTPPQTKLILTVEDGAGDAVSNALVRDPAGRMLGHSDASGHLTLSCVAPCQLVVEAAGFATTQTTLNKSETVRLKAATAVEQVTVTAYRAPLGELESPATTRLLTQSELQSAAAVTMDDKLRELPGVELFRRSSSLVANPTSQGVSLRGLGSTSASRTLVTEDDVPLNDAIGGWIHWEEQPELALSGVEVVRGGASDLYGSSAIGGVVNFKAMHPAATAAELRSSMGGEGTYRDDLLGELKHGDWGALLSGGVLGTDGYIQEAPGQRGPVDIASNVHAQNGLILGERDHGPLRVFSRVSGFNEDRANGTPLQKNQTRLWRYALGGDITGAQGASLGLRLYGSTEHYHQTFTNISNLPAFGDPHCSFRCGETLSKVSTTPANELGGAAHWSQALASGILLLAGADVHDVRVWDEEQTISTGLLTNLHVHQRDTGLYGEAMWVHRAWTVVGSGRFDWFQNYDVHQVQWNGMSWMPSSTQPLSFDQHVFDPRLGVSRKLGAHWALSGSGFRAFRAPTPSELYRSTQVGNQLTKPNGSLLSERATGWEAGIAAERKWGVVRGSYFLTQVNRPITAVTVNAKSSPVLLMRENLGQIESRGVSLDYELNPLRWLSLDGGYQYAHATVTRGSQDLGNWIPEVARNLATLNMRAYRPRVGTLSLQSRLSGRQFDNDANTSFLHGYFRLDAYGSHAFGRRLEVFASGENLFDRDIEVAKTPTTTLGMPRTARAGILVKVGAIDK